MNGKIDLRDVPEFVRRDLRIYAACQRNKRFLSLAKKADGDPKKIAAYMRDVYQKIGPAEKPERRLSLVAEKAVNKWAERASL